jgi:hypothetical protein
MDGGFRYCAKLSLHRVPSHTLFIGKAQQSSATLDDQRAEERVIACQEVTIQRDTDTDSSNHLQIKAAKILSRLLKLINSVCVIYSVYVVVALYFSIPLKLIRPSLKVRAEGLVIGAGQYTFMVSVLISWYVYLYVGNIIRSPESKSYLKQLIVDPCFVDADFIGARASFVHDISSEDLIDFDL